MQADPGTIIMSKFNIEKIRNDFPILKQLVNKKPLVYLDNGATTQKPKQVIAAEKKYYEEYNSNIHRGVHKLSQLATEAYDNAREIVKEFLGANTSNEIVFTKGATDAINLVASTWGRQNIKEGDEIIISYMEHHSNIVPWQMLCEEKKAVLKVIPVLESGELDLFEFKNFLSPKTKLLAITQVSNTLGTINPLKEIIIEAKKFDVTVFVDGCQAVQHIPVNVNELNCDFYCFSGHKIYAPTGIGVLYGKENILDKMPPYQFGGGMIQTVTFEKTTFGCLPHKFEAGTPNIAGAIALAEALKYISEIGLDNIASYETALLNYATEKLLKIPGIRIIGNAQNKAGVISIVADGVHPYDLGTLLDQQGIAVRTGHHCTQPLMDFYCIPGTIRISFAIYNTREEIDDLIVALNKAISMLK